MSQRRILETIVGLGFSEKDAQVYVFLAKKGSRKARDVMTSLKMNKAQLYRSLRSLQSRGLVDSTLECPARFSAVSFEKVLDLLIKAKKDEVRGVEASKDSTLALWNSLIIPDSSAFPDRFMVVEGRNYIFSKNKQMIADAKQEVLVSTSGLGLVRAEQADVLQSLTNLKVPFRILTNVSKANIASSKKAIEEMKLSRSPCAGRHVDLAEKVFPIFVLKDDNEVVFLVSSDSSDPADDQAQAGLWTNNGALVRAFRTLFEQMWIDAVDLEIKIDELENGRFVPESLVIRDPEKAYQKYLDLMESAKKDVVFLVSGQFLANVLKNEEIVGLWKKRGISVKVMAPITGQNVAVARFLSRFCEIRQIPVGYFGVAIVDGMYLLHFKTSAQDQDPSDPLNYFGSSFYSNDPDYVQGRRHLLMEIWSSSLGIPT